MFTPEQMVTILDTFAAHCDENARALMLPQSDGRPAKLDEQHAANRLKSVATQAMRTSNAIMRDLLPPVTMHIHRRNP